MKINVLNIEAKLSNGQNTQLHPVLIELDDQSHYLIDCGYAETTTYFESALATLGCNVSDLKGIIISHDDVDHIEGLHYFKKTNSKLEVWGGFVEQNSLEGIVESERLLQVKSSLNHISDEMKPWVNGFIKQLEAIKRYPLTHTLNEGDLIGTSLEVIATPGHTKGHLSFFDTASKTLIASDALVIESGRFNIANPQFTLDIEQAYQSVKKLKELKPSCVICYHGGMMNEGIDIAFDVLLEQYQRSN